MKFRRPGRHRVRAGLDLTSLIDVVLLLVLFFMLSSTFQVRNTIPVELPDARGTTLYESRELTVTLTAPPAGPGGRGAIYVDNNEVADMDALAKALAERRARIPDVTVLIRADEGVPTGRTVEVLGVAYTAGIRRSLIAAESAAPAGSAETSVPSPASP